MDHIPEKRPLCRDAGSERLTNRIKGSYSELYGILSPNEKNISREFTGLPKGCPTVPAVFLLKNQPKIANSIVPRVIVDVVDDFVHGDIAVDHVPDQSVGRVEDDLQPIPANLATDAHLDRGAVIASLTALLSPSLFPSQSTIPCGTLMRVVEVVGRPALPSQNPFFGIIGEALSKVVLRKGVDVLNRTLLNNFPMRLLARGRHFCNVLGRLIHGVFMFGFRDPSQPNTAWGFDIKARDC